MAKKEILLSICFFGDEDLLWMYYTPDLKQAHVQILDIPAFMASSIMTRVRSDGTVTSYTEIERDDFNTTLEVVSWMFTEE